MELKRTLALVALALSSAITFAQTTTTYGPISSQQINYSYIVGSPGGNFLTVQLALTSACAAFGGNGLVEIPQGATPADAPTLGGMPNYTITGCANVQIKDARGVAGSSCYKYSNSTTYASYPCAASAIINAGTNLAAAVTACGSANTTIQITQTIAVGSGITVPRNCTLLFQSAGNLTGTSITINGKITAAPVQIFGAGLAVTGFSNGVDPRWWGVGGPYASITAAAAAPDDTAKTALAIGAVTGGGWLEFPCGYFHINTMAFTGSVNGAKGMCHGYSYPSASPATVIVSSSTSADKQVSFGNGSAQPTTVWNVLEDIAFQRSAHAAGSTGLSVDNAGGLYIRNVKIEDSVTLAYFHMAPSYNFGVYDLSGDWGESVVAGSAYAADTPVGFYMDSADGNEENSLNLVDSAVNCGPLVGTGAVTTAYLITGTAPSDVNVENGSVATCGHGSHVVYTGSGGLINNIRFDNLVVDHPGIEDVLVENVRSGTFGTTASITYNGGNFGAGATCSIDVENSLGINFTGGLLVDSATRSCVNNSSDISFVGVQFNGIGFPDTKGLVFSNSINSQVVSRFTNVSTSSTSAIDVEFDSTSMGNVVDGSSFSLKAANGVKCDGTSGANFIGINGYDSTITTPVSGCNASFQVPITLTTTGTSGASTFNSTTGALNIPNYATGGGSGITGATAGQTLIAGSATTATSSKALAGSGAALTTGPASGVTTLNVVEFTGTGGQVADSGISSANIDTLTGNQTITGIKTFTTSVIGTLPGSSTQGAFAVGTLPYSDTGIGFSIAGNTNSYVQDVVSNANAGTAASADFIVSNDQGTATTHYGDFGINSSAFSGSGNLTGIAGETYVYGNGGDLGLGTLTNNPVHLVVNNNGTDSITLNTGGTVSVPSLNSGGLTKSIVSSGLLSVAVPGTDYQVPIVCPTTNAFLYQGGSGVTCGADVKYGGAGGLLLITTSTATNVANFNSPLFEVAGSFWTGTAGATDDWTTINTLGSGTNPTSTLTFAHAGSSGAAAVSVPTLIVSGLGSSTSPVCPNGTGNALTTSGCASGLINPMATLGDTIYGAASGTPTRLAGPTTAATYILSETATGSAVAPVWLNLASTGKPIGGTTGTFSGAISATNAVLSSTISAVGASNFTMGSSGSEGDPVLLVNNGSGVNSAVGELFDLTNASFSNYVGGKILATQTTNTAGAESSTLTISHRQAGAAQVDLTFSGAGNGVETGTITSALGNAAITSATGASGVTSVTCQTAACNVSRGSYTVVGGTATTGTIVTLVWPTTTTAWVCSADMNGGTGFLGIGHSVATATGMNITAGITVVGTTFTFDYNCVP